MAKILQFQTMESLSSQKQQELAGQLQQAKDRFLYMLRNVGTADIGALQIVAIQDLHNGQALLADGMLWRLQRVILLSPDGTYAGPTHEICVSPDGSFSTLEIEPGTNNLIDLRVTSERELAADPLLAERLIATLQKPGWRQVDDSRMDGVTGNTVLYEDLFRLPGRA